MKNKLTRAVVNFDLLEGLENVNSDPDLTNGEEVAQRRASEVEAK